MDAKVTLSYISQFQRIRGFNSQSSSGKHQANTKLLGTTHRERHNLRYGHEHQCEVGRNLRDCVGNPPWLILETFEPRYASVPKCSNRRALENCCDDEGKARANNPGIHYVAGDTEGVPGDGENPVV